MLADSVRAGRADTSGVRNTTLGMRKIHMVDAIAVALERANVILRHDDNLTIVALV